MRLPDSRQLVDINAHKTTFCTGTNNLQVTNFDNEALAEWKITGCAVAQHCCNDDQQSQWENGDFDPL